MNILIIGCGSIGRTLAKAMETIPEIEKVYITDKSAECTAKLSRAFSKVKQVKNMEKVLKDVDFVVEAASQQAVREYAAHILKQGRSMLIMSVGALVDEDLRERLTTLAHKHKCKIFLPSGALAGIDGISAAGSAGIDEVILISYKPTQALRNVDYLIKRRIDIDKMNKPTIVFDGSAKDAVKYFPQNINVAATIALAGLGFERTRVKIVADPAAKRNTHRLIIKGEFGEFESTVRNLPFPENPKTSYLAALSAISAIKKIVGDVWIGI